MPIPIDLQTNFTQYFVVMRYLQDTDWRVTENRIGRKDLDGETAEP